MSNSKQSLKKNFVQIVLFGSLVPLCVSFIFLYYLIKINKEKVSNDNTSEAHAIELSIQNSFNRITDSLYKISSSKEIRQLFETTIQNEPSAQKKFKSFLEQEKNILENKDVDYCIYGAQGNLIYSEKLCPNDKKNLEPIVYFIELSGIFVFDMPYVFHLGNEKHLIVLSAIISFDSLKKHYPFLQSLYFTSNDLSNIQLKANLRNDTFKEKMILILYVCILFCLIMCIFSILYGIRIAYFLKNKAQEAIRLATIGKIAHFLAHDIQKPFENISHFSKEISLCNDRQEIDMLISETKHSIQASQAFIQNLLNELMDADAQSLNIQKDLSLQDILNSCFKTLPNHALDNIKVEITLNHTLPLDGDSTKLSRSFFNIITNAVDALKNTPNQKIKIQSLDRRKNVRIIFYNSNSFIEKDDIEKIFDPFYTKKESGTGLGLAISKKMIELHGGTIFCVSKKKVGVSFIVDVPVLQQAKNRLSSRNLVSSRSVTGESKKIFLIDDCPLTLRAWTRTLKTKNEHADIHSFLKFEDFFQFIDDKKITKGKIKKIICDYSIENSSINISQALKKIQKFYSKPIYISTHMDKLIVKNDLKQFNIIVTNKQCIG